MKTELFDLQAEVESGKALLRKTQDLHTEEKLRFELESIEKERRCLELENEVAVARILAQTEAANCAQREQDMQAKIK